MTKRSAKSVSAKTADQPATVNAATTPNSDHSIEIDGTTYRLSLSFQDLAHAERALNSEGNNVNLLRAFTVLNYSTTIDFFACGLRRYHPEISYEKARDLLSLPYALVVGAMVAKELARDLPEVLTDARL